MERKERVGGGTEGKERVRGQSDGGLEGGVIEGERRGHEGNDKRAKGGSEGGEERMSVWRDRGEREDHGQKIRREGRKAGPWSFHSRSSCASESCGTRIWSAGRKFHNGAQNGACMASGVSD